MDVDQPLDALVQQNQKKAPRKSVGNDRNDRRQSGGRREAVPYARPTPRSTDQPWVHDAFAGGRAPRDGPREAQPFTGVSPRIIVTGVHYEVSQADLKSIFQQTGTLVEGPTIQYDRSGRSTGVARMEYATPQQAKAAVNKFDGAMTKGQTISIRLDYPARPNPGAGKEGGSGGSLLSRISGAPAPTKPAPRDRERQPTRGRGRGVGPARGTARPAKPARKAPATQEDLDKELEGFMGRDAAPPAGDVEMA